MSDTLVTDVFDRDEMLRDIIFCVNTAAQLFYRQVPEEAYLIVWHPSGEDGWIAGEVEGRAVPTRSIERKVSELGDGSLSRAESSLVMVRLARLVTDEERKRKEAK